MMAGSTTTVTYPWSFVNFNDFKTSQNVPKYATLEPHRNWLDGTFINPSSTASGITQTNMGYLSTIMTDSEGNFEDDIVITRTYDNNYSTPRNPISV